MSTDVHVTPNGVVVIRLARPAEGNLLTPRMESDILGALSSVSDATRAIVLMADGQDFCVGRVSSMPPKEQHPTAADIRRLVANPILDLYSRLRRAPVPVIALVQGRAMGAGCALAATADLVLASDDAVFGVPELDRDIPPLLVMTALHRRLLPQAMTALVLARENLTAQAALDVGLVGTVVARAELEAAGGALIEKLSANSPIVLRAIKSFMIETDGAGYDAARGAAVSLISIALAERHRQ